MSKERLQVIGAIALYWGIGIVTVIIAEGTGMVNQSNPIVHYLGMFLRAWLWPAFWFWKLREAIIGF